MIPYLITFSIILILTYYAEKLVKSNNKKIGFWLIGLSVCILAFLAGVRNDGVGKDIGVYVIPPFNWAQNFSFLKFMGIGEQEKGYMLLVYITTFLFNDYHVILFIMQAIVSTAVYIFAYKNRENISMLLVVLVYLLVFFNDTLIMMRQSVACAFILISIINLKEKKYLKTAILYILAISFHITSTIAILIYAVMILDASSKISEENKKRIYISLFAGILICVFSYEKILYIITYNIPILPNRFYDYLSSSYYNIDGLSISKSVLIFKTLWIGVSVYMWIIMKKQDAKISFKLLCIDMCIYIASFKLPPILRLGQYFTYPALLTIIPQIGNIFKNDKKKKICLNVMCVAFLIFFWYFTNVIHCENGRTYPYESDIIKNIFLMEKK